METRTGRVHFLLIIIFFDSRRCLIVDLNYQGSLMCFLTTKRRSRVKVINQGIEDCVCPPFYGSSCPNLHLLNIN